MKKITLLLLVFACSPFLRAEQNILTNSNLPIVIITTDTDPQSGSPYDIVDDPKVPATMKIISRPQGERNYLTDVTNAAYLNYNGKIGIELRGSSSQDLPKKPYGFSTKLADNTTNNNVSLLGMPSENDWILNSLAFDPSMIRDFLSYDLSRNMGNYAPRGVFVEVVVNDDYKGVYILMEKIKIDDNRVNIQKMTDTDNAFPNVTGGYIVKADKTTGGDPVAWSMESYNGYTDYLYDNPKPEVITNAQGSYIQSVFFSLDGLKSPINRSIIDGYPSIIDVPSFIDFIIIAELSSNADAYKLSTYFHKDRNGKLRAGPIWDYNLTYGNDLFQWGFDRSWTNIWQFDDGENIGSKFWKRLFNDPTFKCYLSKRWHELTQINQPLNGDVINSKIDQYVTLLSESQAREQTRWGTVGDQTSNIAAMKTWLTERITWITANIGSYAECNQVSLPNLVISKIHYNPLKEGETSSNSLEFIEITNHSNQTVNATGFYIKELGITYQFPVNAMLQPNEAIYLASDTSVFRNFYGLKAYGQFTRNLSNKSYAIVLSDAYGNTIDAVTYKDENPWPTNADGKGSYLELINLDSDNSLASNWRASSITLSNKTITLDENTISLYPNPVQNRLQITSETYIISDYFVTDLSGRILTESDQLNLNVTDIDFSHYEKGVYLINLGFENHSTRITHKLIKIE